MEKVEKGKEGLKMIGRAGDMRIWDKERKEKGGKLEEKKEHMAKKMFATGRGTKKKVLDGLDEMAKHPSLKHYRDENTHIRKGEGITDRDTYRD